MTWTNSNRNKRNTTKAGYGNQHQKLRKALLAKAYGTPCFRCGLPMLPGQQLHLDHTDDRTGYGGFSHKACNLKAAARKARAQQLKRLKLVTPRPTTAHRW